MTAPTFPSHPNPTGSSYNQDEIQYWDARLNKIEQLLEIDTRQAGLQVATAANNAFNGIHNTTGSAETLSSAGAVSIAKLATSISASSGAFTLAAPSADGQFKFIKATATTTATVSGTNVLGQSGKSGHFTASGDALLLYSFGGKWIQIGGNVTWS